LHPHALHLFATHHLSAGSSLAEIKTMLGHQNFNTTLIYAEIQPKNCDTVMLSRLRLEMV
jgi:site-specific recombinase XerD